MHATAAGPQLATWQASDGYSIQGRVWAADSSPAAELFVYLHGIQSHGGWFEQSAGLLAGRGAAVVFPDRRGSGLNPAQRGHTPSIERLLLDIDEVVAEARRQFRVQRVSLVSVSWGGRLAVAWALRRPELVARMLLIAPGLFPAVDVSFLTRCRIAASLLAGGRGAFEIPLNDPALFTDNLARQGFIHDDPLKLTHASARFLYCSSRLERRLRRLPAGALRVGTSLVLAERDRIIRNQPTIAWLRRVTGHPESGDDSYELCILPGAHTLEFAAHPDVFFATLALWRDGKPLRTP